MARIAGIDLPRSKRIDVALTYIYGIGNTAAVEICTKADIEGNVSTDALSDGDVVRLPNNFIRGIKDVPVRLHPI